MTIFLYSCEAKNSQSETPRKLTRNRRDLWKGICDKSYHRFHSICRIPGRDRLKLVIIFSDVVAGGEWTQHKWSVCDT